MSYYSEIRDFNNWLSKTMQYIQRGAEISIQKTVWEATNKFSVSERMVRKRIEFAIKLFDLEVDDDNIYVKNWKQEKSVEVNKK